MPARINPSKGAKPDKLIRDALMIALKRPHIDEQGKKTTKINALATKLVDKAANGDIAAAKEVADRVDGKSIQPVDAGPELTKILREVTVNFVDVSKVGD